MATLPRSRWYGRAVIADSNRGLEERPQSTLEQAALRRIATLVAEGAKPHELFGVVAEEVGRVFYVDPETSDLAVVGRFDAGPELTVVGTSRSVDVMSVGSRWPAHDLFGATLV